MLHLSIPCHTIYWDTGYLVLFFINTWLVYLPYKILTQSQRKFSPFEFRKRIARSIISSKRYPRSLNREYAINQLVWPRQVDVKQIFRFVDSVSGARTELLSPLRKVNSGLAEGFERSKSVFVSFSSC